MRAVGANDLPQFPQVRPVITERSRGACSIFHEAGGEFVFLLNQQPSISLITSAGPGGNLYQCKSPPEFDAIEYKFNFSVGHPNSQIDDLLPWAYPAPQALKDVA